MASARLLDLATSIRSKNAGLFNVSIDDVVAIVAHDAGQGLKLTLRRPRASGNPGDPDVLACQQHSPLYDVLIPLN